MNRELSALAVVLAAFALFLPTRSQAFTHVAVDGRRVRMSVAGSGHATVVFENGYGISLEAWARVQPAVSRFARTVSYDRAGFGLSEDGPAPRDGRRIAAELRRALRAADLPPPYVLVGHSLGGLFVRVFAGRYPDEVAGLVLVDPTHSVDGLEGLDLPELDCARDTLEQARTSPIPAGIPVFLIDARMPDLPFFATRSIREAHADRRRRLQERSVVYEAWLDGHPGASLVVTELSGHDVPMEQPELVVDTIRRVVDQLPH